MAPVLEPHNSVCPGFCLDLLENLGRAGLLGVRRVELMVSCEWEVLFRLVGR